MARLVEPFQPQQCRERLLARRPEGVFVNPFERGDIGPDLFRAASKMGLEGLVSKRRDRPYQAGRSRHWIRVKNRNHPAIERVMEGGDCCRAITAGPYSASHKSLL